MGGLLAWSGVDVGGELWSCLELRRASYLVVGEGMDLRHDGDGGGGSSVVVEGYVGVGSGDGVGVVGRYGQ